MASLSMRRARAVWLPTTIPNKTWSQVSHTHTRTDARATLVCLTFSLQPPIFLPFASQVSRGRRGNTLERSVDSGSSIAPRCFRFLFGRATKRHVTDRRLGGGRLPATPCAMARKPSSMTNCLSNTRSRSRLPFSCTHYLFIVFTVRKQPL